MLRRLVAATSPRGFRSTVGRCALTLAALLLATACRKAGSPRLEGHWRGATVNGVTADVQQQANAFAAETELDFKGDVVAIKTPQGKQTGKYRVVHDYKKSVVITTDPDASKDDQKDDQEMFLFDDEKTMQWRVLDGKSISFHKD